MYVLVALADLPLALTLVDDDLDFVEKPRMSFSNTSPEEHDCKR